MNKYIISYDAHTKEALEKEQGKEFNCKNLENDDFKNILIDLLCNDFKSVNSIDWVNYTTITFTTSDDESIINNVASAIDKLGYCIDYYIALVAGYKGKFIEKTEIRNEVSVSNFKDLVNERCEGMK